jgi:hypothetical protein
MLNPEHFAISLARAVETFRTAPEDVTAQKSALRALVALTKLGEVRVAVRGDAVTVSGTVVPGTLPGIPSLAAQMGVHGVREINFAENASAADLLTLLRALAAPSGAADVHDRLRAGGARSVTVLRVAADRLAGLGRPVSVTEAFDAAPVLAAATRVSAPDIPPRDPLEAALTRLEADVTGDDVLDRVTTAGLCIASRVKEGGVTEAVRALARVIELEASLPEGAARRSFSIVLERLLEPNLLTIVADTVRDPLTVGAAVPVLRRAGSAGARVMLDQLGSVEGDLDSQRAIFRMLGLIGTPEAVRRLIAAAQPGGRFLGRKPSGPRMAAIEALTLVEGPAALHTLESLRGDSDKLVRRAAEEAIRLHRGEDP